MAMNIRYYVDVLSKAVQNPTSAAHIAKRVLKNGYYQQKYERYRRRKGIPLQYGFVHDLSRKMNSS